MTIDYASRIVKTQISRQTEQLNAQEVEDRITNQIQSHNGYDNHRKKTYTPQTLDKFVNSKRKFLLISILNLSRHLRNLVIRYKFLNSNRNRHRLTHFGGTKNAPDSPAYSRLTFSFTPNTPFYS